MTARLGASLPFQGLSARDHHPAVDGQVRKLAESRAGGDDNVFGRECLTGPLDLDRVRVLEGTVPLVHGHIVLLQEKRNAVRESLDDLSAAVDGLAEVDPHVVEDDAELVGVLQEADDLGVAQERLARDAPPVEARPAELRPLDYRCVQSQLRRPDGGYVPPDTAAHDHYVIFCQSYTPVNSVLRVASYSTPSD